MVKKLGVQRTVCELYLEANLKANFVNGTQKVNLGHSLKENDRVINLIARWCFRGNWKPGLT
jgi:hypothetical protein